MFRALAGITALSLGLSAGAASAATVYAQAVTGFHEGGPTTCALDGSGDVAYTVSDDRSNLCNALGPEDHAGGSSPVGFLSAGNYDALKFTFGGPFAGPVDFFEITFNRNVDWVESIVFLLTGDGGSTFAKVDATEEITNTDGVPAGSSRWKITYDAGVGPFNALWVFDNTLENTEEARGGGFDIDAIRAVSVTPVPLPAAGFMLLAGLGGLAMVRRRKG